ncbi:MAG: hypothetical protein NTW67_02865 [Candidatus Woesearchaeota archaeon]|nr:hypothetical protein [Candidatus Woesearchaeota archaeon]
MRLFLFSFILCLIANSALAISVAHGNTEFFYEPGKQIEFPLVITNTRDTTVPVSIETNAEKLTDYTTAPPKTTKLSPNEQKVFTLKISLPNELQKGLYPVSIKVAEAQGMAKSGVETVLNILNPHDAGYPYAILTVDPPREKIHTVLIVRNIGKTQYPLSSELLLKEKDKIMEKFPIEMKIPPLQTQYAGIDVPIDQINKGDYQLELNLPEQQLSQKVRIGEPKIIVDDISLTANKENKVNLPILLDWNAPITTAAAVYIFKNSNGQLFRKEIELTLNPGENIIALNALIPQTAKGQYRAMLLASNQFRADFKANIDSTVNEEIITGKATALPQKNKTIIQIGILLSIAAALLLITFAISRKNEKQNV